jgi:hypothetical protein
MLKAPCVAAVPSPAQVHAVVRSQDFECLNWREEAAKTSGLPLEDILCKQTRQAVGPYSPGDGGGPGSNPADKDGASGSPEGNSVLDKLGVGGLIGIIVGSSVAGLAMIGCGVLAAVGHYQQRKKHVRVAHPCLHVWPGSGPVNGRMLPSSCPWPSVN